MQSAPPEASQNATSVDSPHTQPFPSQHGQPSTSEQASDRLRRGDIGEPTLATDDADTVSNSSTSTGRGRRSDTGRLSGRTGSSNGGSPGSRIEEYEKAHQYGRKLSATMTFTVVADGKGKIRSASIDKFPNGKCSSGIVLHPLMCEQKF